MPSDTNESKKIFVSIACFMDSDVVNTVNDLFRQAKFSERISVGICLQYAPELCEKGIDGHGDFAELDTIDRVRIDKLHYTEARGPIYARYRCEKLLRDEDFFLQIDCHSRFFANWDEILLEEFAHCREVSDKVIISHYPISITDMTNPERLNMIGRIDRFREVSTDDIKMHGTLVPIQSNPQSGFGISAAMLFMESSVKRALPYDANLHNGLHAAEQFLYSARLWTAGYDFLVPTRHALATEYLSNRDRIPDPAWQHYCSEYNKWRLKTWTKVKYYLELDDLAQVDESYQVDVRENRAHFAPGTIRTLVDYYHFTGLHAELIKYFPFYAQRHA
ncbi:MAG: GlcNAc-transferase family protein [Gammaproteobacteria bacterium]|nr:GlcNAc-transferase family protein [Gammaproteobacteria bacterium]